MTAAWHISGLNDVVVRHDSGLPAHLPGAERIGLGTEAAPRTLLVTVPGVGKFQARNGDDVAIQLEESANPEKVRLILSGIIRAALIHQRGNIPLTGSALVSTGGRAIVLSGFSSSGKSTAAYELTRRGWMLLADGIVQINCIGNKAVAMPSEECILLWGDACERFGIEKGNLTRHRTGLEKYEVPVSASHNPATISLIVDFGRDMVSSSVPLRGGERADTLSRLSFRPRLIEPMGCLEIHRQMAARTALSTRMHLLDGARSKLVGDIADQIEELVQ